jgi:hypothetical protein
MEQPYPKSKNVTVKSGKRKFGLSPSNNFIKFLPTSTIFDISFYYSSVNNNVKNSLQWLSPLFLLFLLVDHSPLGRLLGKKCHQRTPLDRKHHHLGLKHTQQLHMQKLEPNAAYFLLSFGFQETG